MAGFHGHLFVVGPHELFTPNSLRDCDVQLVAELDLTVTNTWRNSDTQQGIHTIQLVKPCRIVDTNGLHHDFEEVRNDICASAGVRLVQDCRTVLRWSFVKIEGNGANLRVGDADVFGNWNVPLLLLETVRTQRKLKTKKRCP